MSKLKLNWKFSISRLREKREKDFLFSVCLKCRHGKARMREASGAPDHLRGTWMYTTKRRWEKKKIRLRIRKVFFSFFSFSRSRGGIFRKARRRRRCSLCCYCLKQRLRLPPCEVTISQTTLNWWSPIVDFGELSGCSWEVNECFWMVAIMGF